MNRGHGSPGLRRAEGASAPQAGHGAEVRLGARPNGLRVDSAYTDLKARDAVLAAHADFRKHLYAYDVVPEARPRRRRRSLELNADHPV